MITDIFLKKLNVRSYVYTNKVECTFLCLH